LENAARAEAQELMNSARDILIGMQKTIDRGIKKMEAAERDWAAGGISSIRLDYSQCRERCREYRRDTVGLLCYVNYWSAIDSVLEVSAELETAALRPRMVRRHGEALRRRLRRIEMHARWLAEHPPSKPLLPEIDLPNAPPPPGPTVDGIEPSEFMRKLRALRDDAWLLSEKKRAARERGLAALEEEPAAPEARSSASDGEVLHGSSVTTTPTDSGDGSAPT
jgi:hypothetical protein